MVGWGKLVHGVRDHVMDADDVAHVLQAQPSVGSCTWTRAYLLADTIVRSASSEMLLTQHVWDGQASAYLPELPCVTAHSDS